MASQRPALPFVQMNTVHEPVTHHRASTKPSRKGIQLLCGNLDHSCRVVEAARHRSKGELRAAAVELRHCLPADVQLRHSWDTEAAGEMGWKAVHKATALSIDRKNPRRMPSQAKPSQRQKMRVM